MGILIIYVAPVARRLSSALLMNNAGSNHQPGVGVPFFRDGGGCELQEI